CLQQHDME
ncbi:unnamed protein product, partial [Rotaria sp. Silwood2]